MRRTVPSETRFAPPQVLAPLAMLPGVTALAIRRGEVLLHIDHLPPGVFVVIDGGLVLANPCGCAESVDTHANGRAIGMFLFPALAEVDERAGRSATQRRDGKALYVPRSTVLFDAAARKLLTQLYLREVSMRARAEPAGAHSPA